MPRPQTHKCPPSLPFPFFLFLSLSPHLRKRTRSPRLDGSRVCGIPSLGTRFSYEGVMTSFTGMLSCRPSVWEGRRGR